MLPYPIATGQKTTQLTNSDAGEGSRRDYAGSFVYVNHQLAWVNTPHGRIYNRRHGNNPGPESLVSEFHLHDHLGNTRMVIEKDREDYIVTQQAAYYPFGKAIKSLSIELPDPRHNTQNRHLYNSKEFQHDLGLDWYDYGARFYDAQIARFHTLDPLAENFTFQSPYVYAANNPIRFIDYMGMSAEEPDEEEDEDNYDWAAA